ncbi:extracellular solute-binding protein [Paenibacillus sp. HN-1]|uniref:ABC transporter substrate-binding protein n=1 Tax=Paenibacillus TaxID=44249 RepID=UPI001CA994E8|nr:MULTISPECIES: extracellular solute-binding protein [Paenibacillus]MBY9077912.1 extracellular solute-binding protein [Paenibacillus sp. CGMCC 1.18879]MBY9088132.1 extracellular solute-binding protein [Paenibacillus sinensis]
MRSIFRMNRLCLCLLLLSLTACSGDYPGLSQFPAQNLPFRDQEANKSEAAPNKLVIWSYYDMTNSNDVFHKEHPEVELETKQVDFDKMTEAYTNALVSDDAPDVMIFDSGKMGDFNGLDVFVDLKLPEYHLENVTRVIPNTLIPLLSSFDGKRLLAVPTGFGEALTFYREDLFRQNGLPSEPDEVAAAMSTPQGWLNMAKKLRQNGIYIFQKNTDPLDITSTSVSLFNKDLEFNCGGAPFTEALEVAREVKRSGLALGVTVWDQAGQEALGSGRLAMFVTGQWGSSDLQNWVPDQSGKWRATRLPLGIYGMNGGAVVAITKKSANKELAAQYVKRIVNLTDLGKPDAYLGGQNTTLMVRADIWHLGALTPTPLDSQVKEFWNDKLREAVESDLPVGEQWANIQTQLEILTKDDRASLLMRKKNQYEAEP